MSQPILQVRNLMVEYATPMGPAQAVSGVNLDLAPGEFLAIVGESGCGKSTLLFAIAQLLTYPASIVGGSVTFNGVDLQTLKDEELRRYRWRDISVVMQSAMNALNPTLSIGAQLADACRAHTDWDEQRIAQRSAEVLAMVSIDRVHLKSFPFQLSGGMRQRAMIAMALLLEPKLVIMDEPTSALDVVAQRSLMRQVEALRHELGFAVLFVTHDMSVVSHFSDRLAVMYAGEVVELDTTREVFDHPRHPYSQGLMEAFPSLLGESRQLTGIPGTPPALVEPPMGCLFAPRCPYVMDVCRALRPELITNGTRAVRCHLVNAPESS
ncbi:MAG TPA: ABC transporter ATP-binding protein [Acidimicrobiales bacterium]|nr:ABC transporter ATP-binding protein [Acidimicrobiales bacterium]